jgi:hypothetical protein
MKCHSVPFPHIEASQVMSPYIRVDECQNLEKKKIFVSIFNAQVLYSENRGNGFFQIYVDRLACFNTGSQNSNYVSTSSKISQIFLPFTPCS